jgi:hypothetical protein
MDSIISVFLSGTEMGLFVLRKLVEEGEAEEIESPQFKDVEELINVTIHQNYVR